MDLCLLGSHIVGNVNPSTCLSRFGLLLCIVMLNSNGRSRPRCDFSSLQAFLMQTLFLYLKLLVKCVGQSTPREVRWRRNVKNSRRGDYDWNVNQKIGKETYWLNKVSYSQLLEELEVWVSLVE